MLCCKEPRSLSQSSFYFTCKYAASWHCPLCSVSLVSLSLLHISLCSQSWWPQMPPYLHSSLNVDIHVEGNCKGEDAPHPSPPPGPWCLRHQLPEITGCPENRSTEKMYKYRPYSSWEPDVWKAPLSKKKKKKPATNNTLIYYSGNMLLSLKSDDIKLNQLPVLLWIILCL